VVPSQERVHPRPVRHRSVSNLGHAREFSLKSLFASKKSLPKLTAVNSVGMALLVEATRHRLIDRFRKQFPYSDRT